MAKGILKFNLSDVDETKAHLRAVKSTDMALALWDIVYNTKKRLENSFENKEIDKFEALDLVFQEIYEIYEEHGIKVDDLIS